MYMEVLVEVQATHAVLGQSFMHIPACLGASNALPRADLLTDFKQGLARSFEWVRRVLRHPVNLTACQDMADTD